MTNHKYSLRIAWSEEDDAFIATCPEWPGLMADGVDWTDAAEQAEVAMNGIMELSLYNGDPLPQPELFKWEERYG